MSSFSLGHLLKTHKVSTFFNFLLIPVILIGGYIVLNTKAHAQNSCVARTTISSDSRCLYIMNGNVYQKGSKSAPHQGHPCGLDVSSIIPSFHLADVAKYLDPNLVGAVCAQESPTNTPTPTTAPSNSTPFGNSSSDNPTPTTSNQSNQSSQSNSTNTPTTAQSSTPQSNTQMIYVYLPKPTQQIIYVTATPVPGVTYAANDTLTVNGSPPGVAPWTFYAFPIALILAGFLL